MSPCKKINSDQSNIFFSLAPVRIGTSLDNYEFFIIISD